MGLSAMYETVKDHLMTAGGRDPRTRGLPLGNSYPIIIGIMIFYVVLVKKIGPAYMAKRKPYNIKGLIIAYNLFQVIYNIALMISSTRSYYLYNPSYNWSCLATDMNDTNDYTAELKWASYFYFVNKILDCLDTVFFVMRKKYNQISFLHVYHHALMIWSSFMHLNVFFGSQFSAIGHWNTVVHTLMYTYYLVASLDLGINLYTWKRCMTQIQLLQFAYFLVKIGVVKLNNWCGVDATWLNLIMIENLLMIALFLNFYHKAYIVKKPRESVKAK